MTQLDWTNVITAVSQRLENAGIQYHIDGSASLYVCGLPLENQKDLDDLDIVVNWNQFHSALKIFTAFNPDLKTDSETFKLASFASKQHPIDIMAYPSDSGIGDDKDRCQVTYNGQKLWSKTPEFYLTNNPPEKPLVKKAIIFFGQ